MLSLNKNNLRRKMKQDNLNTQIIHVCPTTFKTTLGVNEKILMVVAPCSSADRI